MSILPPRTSSSPAEPSSTLPRLRSRIAEAASPGPTRLAWRVVARGNASAAKSEERTLDVTLGDDEITWRLDGSEPVEGRVPAVLETSSFGDLEVHRWRPTDGVGRQADHVRILLDPDGNRPPLVRCRIPELAGLAGGRYELRSIDPAEG